MTKIIYYQNDTDDVVTTAHQDYQLPEDYQWVKSSRFYEFISRSFGKVWTGFAWIYCKLVGIEVRNRCLLEKAAGTGYIVYANHTQPFGDVVTPFAINGRKRRVHPIAHPSNLALPVIGRLLPLFGVLPTPQTKAQYGRFLKAIKARLAQNGVIFIYPEAHVWPYYTKIRPFPATSFRFAVDNEVPIFTATSVYVDNGRRKPKQVIYLDGPFYPDLSAGKKNAEKQLCHCALETMTKRSQLSNVDYVLYEKRGEVR